MSDPAAETQAHSGKTFRPAFIIVILITAILTACLLALGTWQVNRLYWKLALIERVEARAYGEPVDAPTVAQWSSIGTPADYEYRRVRLSGTFIHADEVQVYTVSDLGPGYWVMTPLKRDDGSIVIINRGFVPTDKRNPSTRVESHVERDRTVVGLMRAPETGGLFLRTNDPANGRWYSRDIATIAETAGLANTAPFYVDADAAPNPGGLPIGGKTMLRFPNSHLSYAITWFVLAAMTVAAGWYVLRNLNAPKRKHEDD